MADMKTEWAYPLIETTLDKRLSRPGVQKGLAAELTGVDGSDEGGLRPFPGFKRVFTLTDLKDQTEHSAASEVVDFKPVDFRIGSEHYGYGFVYRAKRPAAPTVSDVFIDFWNSGNQQWVRCHKLMGNVPSDAQFDCEVTGRFVYCFATGRSPSLFYVEATDTKVYLPEADAYLDEALPNLATGTFPDIIIRNGGTADGGDVPVFAMNALIRFDTSAEAGALVETAELSLTIYPNFNTLFESVLTFRLVSDPSSSNSYWDENAVTWNNRASGVAWATPGGTFSTGVEKTLELPKAFTGRAKLDIKDLVQVSLNQTGSPQPFGSKTDLHVTVDSNTAKVQFPSRAPFSQNPRIRPTLTVKYKNKNFFDIVVIGAEEGGDIPGPGLQPLLRSPESSVPLGQFTVLDEGRPGSGQIVLRDLEPYSDNTLFPDRVSGVCQGDTGQEQPAPPPWTPPEPVTQPTGECDEEEEAVNARLRIILTSPSFEQSEVSVTPELTWNAVHLDGSPLPEGMEFDVYLGEGGDGDINDPDLLRIGTGLTGSKFEPASVIERFPLGRLANNKKYFWRVRGRRTVDCAYEFTSPVSWFITEDPFKARKFEPGDYTFGYMLVDSKTGRKSAFSQVAQAKATDFRNNSLSTKVQKPRYVGIELVYDSGKYDLLYAYRSLKVQDAGGTMVAGIPFLDAVVKLEDYHTCKNRNGFEFSPSLGDLRHAMYFYELDDKQLVYQTPYIDRSIFDQRMPFGGAALSYDGTMLVSRIKGGGSSSDDQLRSLDATGGLGEMRWSSLQEFSPELFPPFNRYNPTLPSNEVITFSKVGNNAIGLSKNRVYHIRKSGGFIRVQEMHEGYGVVNPKAVDAVGSVAYYASTHGLKAVDSQAQLDELRILNQVFIREWVSDMNDIQLGYDPTMNTLFLLNPNKEEAYCLWFSTAKTTKLADMVFDHVAQGAWPSNFTSNQYANPLQRRAMFLMNAPSGSVGWEGPRVYIADYMRSKTISGATAAWNGSRRITTLDFQGDSRVIATGTLVGGSFAISPTGSTPTVALAGGYTGCYLYCLHSATHPQHVGKKTRISGNTTTSITVDTTQEWTAYIHSGMVFGVSPVYLEWVGHNLGLNNEVNQVFSLADFFRIKMAHTVGCAFTDVAGPPVTDTLTATNPMNRFTAVLYSGTDADPVAKAQTKETDGSLYGSIEDGEGLVYAAFGTDSSDGRYGAKGNSLSPGVRIFCPDLDYRLLACSVRGNILTMERSSITRGS